MLNGTPVNFTFQSTTGITITEIAGVVLQDADYKKPTTRQLVKDGNGSRIASGHTDPITKLTLKYVIKGASLADALANTVLTANGSFVTITACPSMPELVGASKWEVVDGSLRGTNEGFKEVTLDIENAAGIQALAT
jgi:hypothetical protein